MSEAAGMSLFLKSLCKFASGLHANDQDLDELLDSALDDFKHLNISQRNQREEEEGALPSVMGSSDMRSKKRGNEKVSKEDHVTETLDKLREQTRESVKGIHHFFQAAVRS